MERQLRRCRIPAIFVYDHLRRFCIGLAINIPPECEIALRGVRLLCGFLYLLYSNLCVGRYFFTVPEIIGLR